MNEAVAENTRRDTPWKTIEVLSASYAPSVPERPVKIYMLAMDATSMFPERVDIFEATERGGDALSDFLASTLDKEGVRELLRDLLAACNNWGRTDNAEHLIRVLGDWEATAEVYANPELKKAIDEACRESAEGRIQTPA
jgi:hypothetical protein